MADKYVVFADESCIDARHPVYGIGALVVPDDRISDFNAHFEDLRQQHGVTSELKWTKISKSHGQLNFAIAMMKAVLG